MNGERRCQGETGCAIDTRWTAEEAAIELDKEKIPPRHFSIRMMNRSRQKPDLARSGREPGLWSLDEVRRAGHSWRASAACQSVSRGGPIPGLVKPKCLDGEQFLQSRRRLETPLPFYLPNTISCTGNQPNMHYEHMYHTKLQIKIFTVEEFPSTPPPLPLPLPIPTYPSPALLSHPHHQYHQTPYPLTLLPPVLFSTPLQ